MRSGVNPRSQIVPFPTRVIVVVLDPFVATLPLTARGILSILKAVDATVLLGAVRRFVSMGADVRRSNDPRGHQS